MSDDDNLAKLADAAKQRAEARRTFEAQARIDPPTELERARILKNVLPGAPARDWRPVAAASGGVVALAAAVLLFISPSATQLPGYQLELVSRGHEQIRGDGSNQEIPGLRPGMHVEVLLRPTAAAPSKLAARVFVIEDGGPRPLTWVPELAPTGAVRFAGELGRDVSLPLGRQTLRFGVGETATIEAWGGLPSDEVRTLELEVEMLP